VVLTLSLEHHSGGNWKLNRIVGGLSDQITFGLNRRWICSWSDNRSHAAQSSSEATLTLPICAAPKEQPVLPTTPTTSTPEQNSSPPTTAAKAQEIIRELVFFFGVLQITATAHALTRSSNGTLCLTDQKNAGHALKNPPAHDSARSARQT